MQIRERNKEFLKNAARDESSSVEVRTHRSKFNGGVSGPDITGICFSFIYAHLDLIILIGGSMFFNQSDYFKTSIS